VWQTSKSAEVLARARKILEELKKNTHAGSSQTAKAAKIASSNDQRSRRRLAMDRISLQRGLHSIAQGCRFGAPWVDGDYGQEEP
jgi:hypothetical protein